MAGRRPGRLPSVIAVGANCKSHDGWSGLCGEDGVATFSNRGPPSTSSADPPPPGSASRSDELADRLLYTWGDGTSVAAPQRARR